MEKTRTSANTLVIFFLFFFNLLMAEPTPRKYCDMLSGLSILWHHWYQEIKEICVRKHIGGTFVGCFCRLMGILSWRLSSSTACVNARWTDFCAQPDAARKESTVQIVEWKHSWAPWKRVAPGIELWNMPGTNLFPTVGKLVSCCQSVEFFPPPPNPLSL